MHQFKETYHPLEICFDDESIVIQQGVGGDGDFDAVTIGHAQVDGLIESLKRVKARYERQMAKGTIEDLKKQLDDDNAKRFPHLVDGEGPEAA